MIRVVQEGDDAVFRLEGYLGKDRFSAYQAAVAGCHYDPTRRVNFAPVYRVLVMLQRLAHAGFTKEEVFLDPALRSSIEALVVRRRRDLVGAEGRAAEIDRRMREKGIALYPFQREGVCFLAGRRGALLSDAPGLGKSVQTLAAIPDKAPVLVVGPAVAKGVWAREAAVWRPDLKVTVLTGRSSFRWPAPGELVVLNYELLPPLVLSQGMRGLPSGKPVHVFNTGQYGEAPEGCVFVVDEAQYCKSSRSERSLRVRAIAECVRDASGRVWLLSGTPVMNAPPELWNVLRIASLEREAFESWKKFTELFGGSKDPWGGMKWSDTPDASVPERLRRVMLRRTKAEVLPDLPPKTVRILEVEVGNKEKNALDKIAYQLSGWCDITDPYALLEMTRRERVVFDTVARLRVILAMAKIPAMEEICLEHEEAWEPLLVMSAHLEPLRALKKREGWAVIDGSTKSEMRAEIQEKFQKEKLFGIGCSIKAAGTALTLTRSAYVLFVDEAWTPSDNEQAEDRACRIGQMRGVLVTRMFADHELDRHVLRVLGRKEKLVEHTLGEVR